MSKPATSIDLSDTGTATAHRGYANSGVHIGDVNLRSGASVKTRYRHQVQRFVPDALTGRDAEIAMMAEFARSADTAGQYWCWEAGPWSGKSALLSWFVLHPPESVRIVSFFVTARHAAQSNRNAFVANVLEQLLALLGEDLPPLLNDTTQDAHLLGLLDDAADACQERGESLVLVVDGLDEDRGVTVGAEAHSIAALLPERLPATMKAIVSRRPNPPTPADVGARHPLRNPATVRVLEPSPAAQIVRGDMERELDSLLLGSPEERDLLGTLVAAGGGLTARDLSSLTGLPEAKVERQLSVVSGRSFSRRDSHYPSMPAPDVFILAHEELQETARRTLGAVGLRPYRNRLAEWAGDQANKGWPEPVPDYLLFGYHSLLLAEGDLAAATNLVTDPNRYNRMLDRSGSDVDALSQINTALRAATVDGQNLPKATKLAVHRDHLLDRNSAMTIKLPLAWAKIGNFSRAERLIRSMIQPETACFALALLSGELHHRGQVDRAEALLKEASAASASFPDAQRRNWTRSAVVFALATTGRLDDAERLAVSDAADTSGHSRVIRMVVQEAARASDIARCERLIPLVTAPFQKVTALIATADADSSDDASGYLDRALAAHESMAAGEPKIRAGMLLLKALMRKQQRDRVDKLLDELETGSRSLQKASTRAEAMVSAARAAFALGSANRARILVDEAVGLLLKSRADAQTRLRLVAAITDASVEIGGLEGARKFADSLEESFLRSESLVALAGSAASMGEEALALEWLQLSEKISRFAFGPDRVDRTKASAALISAARGNLRAATRIANSITSAANRGKAFVAVAHAAGTHVMHWPTDFLTDPALNVPDFRRVRLALIQEAASAGATDLAVKMAMEIPNETQRRRAMIVIAEAVAIRGELDEATAMAQTIRNNEAVLAAVANAAASQGQLARVEALCSTIQARGPLNRARRALAEAAARTGDLGRALSIVAGVSPQTLQDQARGAVVVGLAGAGRIADAERVAAAVEGTAMRNRAMAALAVAEAEAGNLDRSAVAAGRVTNPSLITESFTTAAMSRSEGAGKCLLAHALLHGSWIGCVVALHRLHPEALDMAESALQETTRHAEIRAQR
ncbi:hypothetical protein [Micromonospora sp. NPDC049662]|uniref:hypothetical protein n=1 Tax=Micromonospora sp. NPDC049662 TaxID=3155397 RepID=UPI0034196244